MVFPSLSDIFGLTMIEALVCGFPAVAVPVSWPAAFSRQSSTAQLFAGLAASRSSVMIANIAARRQMSQAGDTH